MKEQAEVGGRRHVRVSYPDGTVTVRCHRSGSFLPGTLVDISISGCLITMTPPIEVTRSQVIELRFDLNSLAFRVLGFVRHVNHKTNAIGVEFHHLAENDRRDLDAFIEYFAPGRGALVRRRITNVVDDEHRHGLFGRFELQSKLFLNRREERWG